MFEQIKQVELATLATTIATIVFVSVFIVIVVRALIMPEDEVKRVQEIPLNDESVEEEK